MKLYREVKASERLPSDTTFKVIRDVTTSSKSFIHLVFSEVGGLYTPHVPEYWLEPIEITEEEICVILNSFAPAYNIKMRHFGDVAKAILSKLSGE